MKKILKKTTALMLAVSMVSTLTPAMTDVKAENENKKNTNVTQNYNEGQAVVVYKDTSTGKIRSKSMSDGIDIVDTCVFEQKNAKTRSVGSTSQDIKMSLVQSDTYSTEQIIEKLKNKSGVVSVQPNYIYKASSCNDTYYDYQWALDNKGQNGGTEGFDINADNEALSDKDSKERVVAIIDTGVDYTHEDLQGAMWENPYSSKELVGKHGYNFVDNNDTPMDDNGHGTHVAGIMKATSDNATGIVGAAKSSNIKIMALKFLDNEGAGDTFAAVEAYNYIYKAQLLGTNVVAVNDSWGGNDADIEGSEEDSILKSVIDMVGKNGAITVAAAGNAGSDNDVSADSPSGLDSDYIISVASSNEKGQLSSFSNYGKKKVDIAAPGSNILSTVNYNCYNPGIYSDPMKLSSTYVDFNSGKLVNVQDNGFSNDKGDILYGVSDENSITTSLDNDAYIGLPSEDEKSIQFKIQSSGEDNAYYVYLPYEVGPSDTPISVSAMLQCRTNVKQEDQVYVVMASVYDCKLTEDGSLDKASQVGLKDFSLADEDCFEHIQSQVASKIKKKEKRALVLELRTEQAGEFTINIDNFGVSKENVSADQFGKYDYYSGTSMAAPYVTAAVATIANTFNTSKVLDVKDRVLGCVREVPELSDKVSTGGILDLSKAEMPVAFIQDIALNSKKQIEIKGAYLTDAKVYLDGSEVKQISNNGKTITIDGSKFLNKSVNVKIVKDEKTYVKDMYFAGGKAFTADKDVSISLSGGQLVSTGTELLYVNDSGAVSQSTFTTGGQDLSYDFDDDDDEDDDDDDDDDDIGENVSYWTTYKPMFTSTIFGKEYKYSYLSNIAPVSDYVYSNKTLYGCLKIGAGYSTKTIIAYFDNIAGWRKYADVSSDKADLDGVIFTSYDGQLYLIGGMDENGDFSKKVYKYDSNTKKWTKATDLPEGRAYAKAHQVGKKLVITLGASKTETIPKNIIFDGKKWTLSKTGLGKSVDTTKTVVSEKEIYMTTAQTGIVADGIIYTNLRVDGKGDTFTYDVNKDTYKGSAYSLNGENLGATNIMATTVDNRLYVIYGNNVIEDDYWDLYAKEPTTTSKDDDDYTMEYAKTLCINVANGFVNVVDKSVKGAYVSGAGCYLPGDTVTLTAKTKNKKSVISAFWVNGKKIKKSKQGYVYKTLSTNISRNCTAKVVLKTSTTSSVLKKASRSKNNKKINLTFKKVKNVSGYQIKYSTSRKFKKKLTKVAKTKKMKYVLKGLKKNKKYFIKVRTYRKKGKKTTYGKWSKTKTVAVRKNSKKNTKKNNKTNKKK